VARRIDALEHGLRLTLFKRDTRGFSPTAEAVHLTAAAERIEAAAAAFAHEADNQPKGHLLPIRITMPRTNFSDNFSAIISDFRSDHPDVQFEFISTYDVLDLGGGAADIAIRISKTVDDPRLICRKLTTVTASLYASQSYADRHGLPRSEAELLGHRFVVYDRFSSSLGVNDWLLDRIDPAQIVSHCSDAEAMIAAVKSGIGIGIINTSMAQDIGTLLRCFPPPEGTSASSWLLINPDAYCRPEVKAFSAFFAPRFQAIFKGRKALD
jgi:DNA-binding transcriptional LysR family regulator